MSKEDIVAAIRREAAANGGLPLGMRKFVEATGIGEHEWKGRYWARWNDALADAGFSGRDWGNNSPMKSLTASDAAGVLATLTREYGHFPTGPELMLRKRTDSSTPHPSVFTSRLGSVDEQRAKVYVWATEHEGWDDVAEIVRPLVKSAALAAVKPGQDIVVNGYVYLLRSGDFYKIGRSNHVGRREYEVALQLPERVDTVHSIETDDAEGIESYWHRRFADKRANGEWFKLSDDDVAAFKRRKYQ